MQTLRFALLAALIAVAPAQAAVTLRIAERGNGK